MRLALVLLLALMVPLAHAAEDVAVEREYHTAPNAPSFQTPQQADAKSAGCVSCHTDSDQKTMHRTPAVVLGCTDCHGGNPAVMAPAGEAYKAQAPCHGSPVDSHGKDSHAAPGWSHVAAPSPRTTPAGCAQSHLLRETPRTMFRACNRLGGGPDPLPQGRPLGASPNFEPPARPRLGVRSARCRSASPRFGLDYAAQSGPLGPRCAFRFA
jgi:hypothetical protein